MKTFMDKLSDWMVPVAGGFLVVVLVVYFGILYRYPVAVAPGTSPTPIQVAADWKYYYDQEFGFSVKYPPSWHSEECKDSSLIGSYVLVVFGDLQNLVVCNSDAPLNGYVTISASHEVPSMQEMDSIMEYLDGSSRTNITVDGQPAVRIEGKTKLADGHSPATGSEQVTVLTSRDGVGYRFMYNSVQGQNHLGEFNGTVSTFKFSGEPSTSSDVVYRDELFGFQIVLPKNWQGYTINRIKGDIYDATGKTKTNNGVVDSFQLVEIHHPLETAQSPREVIPVMVLTPEQWMHIQKEEWSVGAAPIPPSELGHNAQWVLALPARYNYDFKPGWEEVDQLVHTLTVFEPGSTTDTSTWKTYTNTEYGFELKYPSSVTAGDVARNSMIGQVDKPTPGIYVGPLVLVPLVDTQVKATAHKSVFGKECPAHYDGLGMPYYCVVDLDVHTGITSIRAISVGPEGAAAMAYLSGGKTDIFVDFGSEGYDFGNHGRLSMEEYLQILSTFKFTK